MTFFAPTSKRIQFEKGSFVYINGIRGLQVFSVKENRVGDFVEKTSGPSYGEFFSAKMTTCRRCAFASTRVREKFQQEVGKMLSRRLALYENSFRRRCQSTPGLK